VGKILDDMENEKEVDYNKTVIYKIICKDENIKEIYVGHATDFLYRQWTHIMSCVNPQNKSHNVKLYQVIRANGGWKNWEMIQLEEYPCANLEEARKRELFWYEELKATLNSIKPYVTKEGEKERDKETNRIWYEKNKEKIAERRSVKISCDNCGKSVCKRHLTTHKKSKDCINFIKNLL